MPCERGCHVRKINGQHEIGWLAHSKHTNSRATLPSPRVRRRTNTGTLLMGQDLVCFAAEDDAGHAAPTMRSHADQIASLFLRHGDNLRVDIVALHQYCV